MQRLSKLAPVVSRMVLRTSQPVVFVHARVAIGARFNSNNAANLTAKEKRDQVRQDHAKLHDAMRDWQAPVITYEQLKPKTESPDPVSPSQL
jgi:hypothetical protein